jgi:hypothetical protein
MAYFLGKDVEVFLTTEQGGVAGVVSGAFVDAAKASATMGSVDGGSDIFFAEDRTCATGNYQAITNMTGVDVSIGAVDEDISYFGLRSVTKAEIKKETTVTLTRKKIDAAWEVVYDLGRYGCDSTGDFTAFTLTEPTVNTGYRIHVSLKSGTEVFSIPGCCVQAHSVSVNADGTSEETLEFMSYITPNVGNVAYTGAIDASAGEL